MFGSASIEEPEGIAVGPDGVIVVSDGTTNRVVEIAPDLTVTTLASDLPVDPAVLPDGGCSCDCVFEDRPECSACFDLRNRFACFTDARSDLSDAGMAILCWPRGVAVDGLGTVYVADSVNNRIRAIAPDGGVATVAGNGQAGGGDGSGLQAEFFAPSGLALDGSGHLFVTDPTRVRRLDLSTDEVTTVAGDGQFGCRDGPGAVAEFHGASGIAVDSAGNLFVADEGNAAIREISPDGEVTTIAGQGYVGYGQDGSAAVATFSDPVGIAIGPDGTLYVADEVDGLRVIKR